MNLSLKRILIVENDNALAELLEEVLHERNYNCLILPYAEEILSIVQDFKPDVVLLDYLLPVVNGQELCDGIKHNKPTSRLPVIIYSAFPKTLLPLGEFLCDNFVSKPFDLFYLLHLIDKLASGYKYRLAKDKLSVFHLKKPYLFLNLWPGSVVFK